MVDTARNNPLSQSLSHPRKTVPASREDSGRQGFCILNFQAQHSLAPAGIASLTMSIEVLPTTRDLSEMIEEMESQKEIHYVKILARE